ncbi:MAG TPA: NADPH-dependent oxidoreductase [Prolixibacteraceae bacterium]|jgi:nitroreductase|nr:NADPH-dependent oxidoreductase [Prolixibacteraceae bacterium]
MKLLTSHRSIRSYQQKEIENSVLDEILESGIRAYNTGNMQLYSVIVTRNTEKKKLLAPLHFNQKMVVQAPVLLTICVDINRFYKWCTISNTEANFKNLLWLLNGTIDASILAQNICIASENLGLGICYLGTALYNAAAISAVLKLPVGVIPITALSMGYPDNIPELTDRLPLEAVVHYEEYNDFDEFKIRELYKDKENLETSIKFIVENGKDSLAQVYTDVRYKKEDNEFFSKKIIQLLTNQGFCLD